MAPHPPSRTLPCGRQAPTREVNAVDNRLQTEWNQRFRDYLVKTGLKYTEPRWQIAQLILETTSEHLNAQEIVERVREKHPKIGVATVYRNIKVLCDAKILKQSLTNDKGVVVYERFEEDHHDHLVCMDCGEIFEFHDSEIEERQELVARERRFEAVSHKHVVYVRCLELNKKNVR